MNVNTNDDKILARALPNFEFERFKHNFRLGRLGLCLRVI